MSQSIAPDNVLKRSLLPTSQDSALPVGKRQKETKELMSDKLHLKSDKNMKRWGYPKAIDGVIETLWCSVAAAEVSLLQQPQFSSVFKRLQDTKYVEQPELGDLIDKCIANKNWRELQEHGLKFLDRLNVKQISPGAIEATERSWGVEYRGFGSEALRRTILSHALDKRSQLFYAQAIPIVQSSGTGKSRMIDELGKTMLVIPLNLRPPKHTGKAVISFLLDIWNIYLRPMLTSYAQDNGYDTVIFSFDEIHGLSKPLKDQPGQNVFHCLPRALNTINEIKSLVSVFLTTASVVHDYAPPTYLDPSLRVKDRKSMPIPFYSYWFRPTSNQESEKDIHYLRDMVSVEWMCQFGRPLFGTRYNEGGDSERRDIVKFAATKLLGGHELTSIHQLSDSDRIAILATRISLCFTRTSLTSRAMEFEQVEYHMRFFLGIKNDNETAITIAPSEPILAEGAAFIVRKLNIDQARLLENVLSGPSLDKGDR
ncbi:hypothetical protein C0993_010130, partial [Termitomyces sp. T159_Od127]